MDLRIGRRLEAERQSESYIYQFLFCISRNIKSNYW